jgi:hypothetical protein
MNAEEWAAVNCKGTQEEQQKWEEATMRKMESFRVSCEQLRKKKQFERGVMGSQRIARTFLGIEEEE